MKLIRVITEKDFGRQDIQENWPTYRVRPSARAILFNESGEIALMHVTGDSYYKLPGGGINNGEEIYNALQRELREEVGASAIEVMSEIGQIDEYRDEVKRKSAHYCYVAKLTGPIVEPAPTSEEISEGYETVWAKDIDEAIRLVESGEPTKYGHDFERMRELTFLKYAKSSNIITA